MGLRNKINNSKYTITKKFYLCLWTLFLNTKCSYIGHTAIIKSPPCFPHGISGIFISGGATIGYNAVIFQQVTIGSNTLQDSKGKGFPTIGDNCYIGAGAKIIGNVTIGNNVRIGANCVVTADIPDNSVVVLEKPRIICKNSMDNQFYSTKKNKLVCFDKGKWIEVE